MRYRAGIKPACCLLSAITKNQRPERAVHRGYRCGPVGYYGPIITMRMRPYMGVVGPSALYGRWQAHAHVATCTCRFSMASRISSSWRAPSGFAA